MIAASLGRTSDFVVTARDFALSEKSAMRGVSLAAKLSAWSFRPTGRMTKQLHIFSVVLIVWALSNSWQKAGAVDGDKFFTFTYEGIQNKPEIQMA